jgi:hypothetical protein
MGIFSYCKNPSYQERERKGKSSLLALLERDRENSWQFINQTVIRAVSIRTPYWIEQSLSGLLTG